MTAQVQLPGLIDLLRWPQHIERFGKSAVLSADRRYRYGLFRIWDLERPLAMFVGLNPSTADETDDDPTIRRCVRFASDWQYGGLIMANLFAYRATSPRDLPDGEEAVGALNDADRKSVV